MVLVGGLIFSWSPKLIPLGVTTALVVAMMITLIPYSIGILFSIIAIGGGIMIATKT